MRRLTIKWTTQSSVTPRARAAATGVGSTVEAEESAKRVADRPMLVYVTSDDNTDPYTRKLEDVCFPDERIGIGSRFFKCIKITAGDALQDRVLAKHGKGSPRILILSRDYKVMGVLEGKKISSGRLVKAMSHVVRKEYKNSFDQMVSGYGKLLNELDRLEGEKALLADKVKRAGESKAKLSKIAREKVKFEKSVAKWEAAEKKLLAFKLSPNKKTKV